MLSYHIEHWYGALRIRGWKMGIVEPEEKREAEFVVSLWEKALALEARVNLINTLEEAEVKGFSGWKARAEKLEALLEEWLEAPYFQTEATWRAWRDAFASKVYAAALRAADAARARFNVAVHACPACQEESA